MSDISLTASMRSNLLALQSTVDLMGRTQDRLSTGKKVNSALDNPTNYFTAKSHTQRANDLLGFKDAISESIQTIKAADTAIKAITTLINSAKAVAESAKELLTADKATELTAKQNQYNTMLTQIGDLQADAFYKGKNLLAGGDDMTVRFGNSHTLVVTAFSGTTTGLGIQTTASWTTASLTDIGTKITNLETALTTLQVESSKLSSNLAIVDARSQWITDIANTLQIGADNLTNADSNEEGANMLMLQTRQSLSTSALSMSAQAAQSVLRLFQ